MKNKNASYNQMSSQTDEVFFNLLDERIKKFKVPVKLSKEKAWENFLNSLEKKPAREIQFPFTSKIVAIAASVLIAFIGYWYYYQNKPETILCKKGETRTLVLPDRSVVNINAASTLTYYPKKWSRNREIKLEGEACFKVTKGNTFRVLISNGEVKVLGTRFNVLSRGNDFKVFCVSGKVSVTKDKEVFLTKGEECCALNNSNITQPIVVNDLKPISWIKGEFWFTNVPLHEVFEEFERQFGMEVILTIDSGRYYTGYFNKNNLENALINVCKPMSLTYIISENKIIIK